MPDHDRAEHNPAMARSRPPRGAEYVVSRDAAREIDRAAIEDFGIPGIVLMENAARGLTEAALDLLHRPSDGQAGKVLIVCGSGNNGGDGYALARHLQNHGVDVLLMPLGTPRSGSDAAMNREICRKMSIIEIDPDDHETIGDDVTLFVDAIFGTGLDREIVDQPRTIINWINDRRPAVLAVDVPSGLDADTGETYGVCVRATMTVTFIAMKPSFRDLSVQRLVGEVRVADIGAPHELLERHGTRLPPPPPGAVDRRREVAEVGSRSSREP